MAIIKLFLQHNKRKFASYIEEKLSWVRYPKFSRDRNYLTTYERYSSYNEKKFANIGAGSYFFHRYWHNYDFYSKGEEKISRNFFPMNLLEIDSLPEKYTLIYSSHVFEHIPRKYLKKFISMIKSSMKENGTLRIVVPDADLIYDAYIRKDFNFFKIYESKIGADVSEEFKLEFLLLDMVATEKRRVPLTEDYILKIRQAANEMSKPDFLDFLLEGVDLNRDDGMNHVNWFNYDKLEEILISHGFRNVRKSGFGQCYHPPMQEIPLFDGWLPRISLYVEADC